MLGRNPTWLLRPNHVYLLLQIILDYWADYWGVERIDLHPPIPKRDKKRGSRILNVLRERRYQNLLSAYQDNVIDSSNLTAHYDMPRVHEEERRLFSAMVKQAFRDFIQNALSPFHHKQRDALNAYWWVMGLPLLLPEGVGEEDIQKMDCGKQNRYRLREHQNPFEDTWLRRQHLWLDEPAGSQYYPWEVPHFDQATVDLMSMENCCRVVGLNVTALRARLHVLPPDWTGKDDGLAEM